MRRIIAAAVALGLYLGAGAAANGPVADFPRFIPFFTTDKTGDVAIDRVGSVYVSVRQGEHVKVWEFSADGNGPTVAAHIGVGEAYGLTVDPKGDLYATMGGPNKGVYRARRDGDVLRLPGTEQIAWPNSLAFDTRGNLYVTESYSMEAPSVYGQGGIWRIAPGGDAEIWVRDDLLTGTGALQGLPIGANGIACYHGDLYVVNSDKAVLVRIRIRPDGSPGEPEVWAALHEVPESPLAGSRLPVAGDGLALDVYGNAYVAMVTRSAVVRINAEDASQETIAALRLDVNAPLFAPLDTPNSVAFGTGKGGRQALFATNLGWMTRFVPGPRWPGAGIVKLEAGMPGLPLRGGSNASWRFDARR